MDSDTERIERLKAVQMADLGNARREFITTADNDSNFSQIGLKELDASRQSNIPGTEAFKMAKANKVELDKWRNFHTTINDEGSINAQLGEMMHGQSHRAQLIENFRSRPRPSNTMFQFGASQPAPPNKFSNSPNPSATNPAYPSPYRGRGRGGNGGRGRGMHSSTVSTSPRAHFMSMPSRLDPALDSNNVTSATRGAGVSKSRKPAPSLPGKRATLNPGTSNPLMRVTRPTPVSPFKIASPQEFMVQARPSLVASGAAPPKVLSPLNPARQPHETTVPMTTVPKTSVPATTVLKTTVPTTAPVMKDNDADVATTSVPQAATPTPSPRIPARKILAPRPKRVETLVKKVETTVREASPLKKVEVASSMAPINIPVKAILQEDDKGKKTSQSVTGVLLDFGSTATTTDVAEAPLITFSSPSIEELSGVDFPTETFDANAEPPSPSPVDRSLNAETIKTTTEEAITQEEVARTLRELENEIAHALGYAAKFDFSGLISLKTKLASLSSAVEDKPEEKSIEGSSSKSTETNPASHLTNVAFPAPIDSSHLSNVATATEPVTPPRKNFSEYRSPPQTSSSEESKENFYDAAEMNQSPRKSVGTEGVKGFETLKVSGSSARVTDGGPAPIFKMPAVSQSSIQSTPQRNPSGGVESSIFAKPKVIGPQPKLYEKPTGGISYEPLALQKLNPANAATKAAPIGFSPFQLGPGTAANVPRGVFPPLKPPATIGPAPYKSGLSSSDNASDVVIPLKKEEPMSKVKILGPAPYQPKRK